MLRRIFGPKRDEVTGERKRLHNEELYALYSSQNIVQVIKLRRMRWAGHVVCTGERRVAYGTLVGKPEERSLVRPKRKWKDNIKMALREMGWGHGLYRSASGQKQVAGSCTCGNNPSGSINCGTFLIS